MGCHRQFIDTAAMRRAGSITARNHMKAILSITLLCCSPVLLLRAQHTDASASGAIRALQREWVAAQSHNDNRALDLILDNAVVYVEYGQRVTKADYLLRIKPQDPATDKSCESPSQ